VYAQLERPLVAVANGLLHETPMEARTLSFERREDGGTYSYELRVGELGRRVERDMHAHGFVALLFVALVLGTPWLGARRLALRRLRGRGARARDLRAHADERRRALGRGGSAAMNLPPGSRPYGVPIGFAAGLHQTAAGGLLPIVYWVLVAIRPAAPRA